MEHLNLLPRERLLNLRREMAIASVVRLVSGIAIGLGALTLVGLALAAGLWGLSFVDTDSGDEFVTHMSEYLATREAVDQTNQLLRLVEELGQGRIVWSDALVSLLSVVPSGVTLDELAVEQETGTIVVSGSAPTRASVVAFEEQLRGVPWATDVEAPRENLLRRNNPDYTFTLHVNAEQLSARAVADDEDSP